MTSGIWCRAGVIPARFTLTTTKARPYKILMIMAFPTRDYAVLSKKTRAERKHLMTKFLVPAILALTALPAAAQDANGLSFGGEVKLEYLDAGSHHAHRCCAPKAGSTRHY